MVSARVTLPWHTGTEGNKGHVWSPLRGGWGLYPQGFAAHSPLKPPGLCPPGPSWTSVAPPACGPTELLGAGHGFPAFNNPQFSKYGHQRQDQPRAASSFLFSPCMEKQRDFSLVLFWWLRSIDWDMEYYGSMPSLPEQLWERTQRWSSRGSGNFIMVLCWKWRTSYKCQEHRIYTC